MSCDPLRRQAWEILLEVESGTSLEPRLGRAQDRLDPQGRRLLAELVRGTLAMQGRYDHLIEAFSRQKPKTRIRLLLRMGLHQLLACDSVPAYAALNESVNLAKETDRSSAGYVNAVLARAARILQKDGLDGLAVHFPDRVKTPEAFLSAWYSHPRWLVARWLARFGVQETEALCSFNNQPAIPSLHVLRPHSVTEIARRLSEEDIVVEPGRLCDRALNLGRSLPRRRLQDLLAAYPELIVQDEAVQAATDWLIDGVAGRFLDLCAAPGGKTVHARAALPGLSAFVAMDLRPRRVRKVAQTLRRTGVTGVHLLAADGCRPPFAPGSFDAILLDGPCSGTGVIRHHPEGRWRLEPRTLRDNAQRLLDLADAAVSLLAGDGRLLYATCSLEPEENQDVIRQLLEKHPDLVCQEETHMRQWLPQRDGADGFFAARLVRRGQ